MCGYEVILNNKTPKHCVQNSISCFCERCFIFVHVLFVCLGLISTISRIQFRLPDGSSFTNQFPSQSRLQEAWNFAYQVCLPISHRPCMIIFLSALSFSFCCLFFFFFFLLPFTVFSSLRSFFIRALTGMLLLTLKQSLFI